MHIKISTNLLINLIYNAEFLIYKSNLKGFMKGKI